MLADVGSEGALDAHIPRPAPSPLRVEAGGYVKTQAFGISPPMVRALCSHDRRFLLADSNPIEYGDADCV